MKRKGLMVLEEAPSVERCGRLELLHVGGDTADLLFGSKEVRV